MRMRKSIFIAALFIAGSTATLAAYFHRQSKPSALRPLKMADQGVLRHDPSASAEGINILTTFSGKPNCEVFDNEGKRLGVIPGNYCLLLPGFGFVSLQKNELVAVSPSADVLWSKTFTAPHHDLTASLARREIAVLDLSLFDYDRQHPRVKSNDIYILDWSGSEKFRWRERDHVEELKALQAPREFLYPTPGKDSDFEFSHMNSVQIIEAGFERTWGPAFREGNLLVSLGSTDSMVVIDRATGEIVWSFREKDYYGMIHSARLTPDGLIVYFKNHAPGQANNVSQDEFHERSEVAMIGPGDTKPRWSFAADSPDVFYSHPFGHVEPLPNGDFLVTDNPWGGRAFELTREKKIVWEWTVSPIEGGRPKIYQVIRVPKGPVQELLSALQ